MYRMRKGLAALIAAFFFLGMGGKAQAVIGIPDDVPASTLLFPFFKVQSKRTASDNQDTLLVVTNTSGASAIVHVTVWSISSVHIYDFSVTLTAHDVFSCSLFDLLIGLTGCANETAKIAPAPTGVAAQLPPPAGVTGTDATLIAGYVTADVVLTSTSAFPGQPFYPFAYSNVLIGHQYLVNLPAGSSSGVNATSIETRNPCTGHVAFANFGPFIQNAFGFYRTRCGDEQGLDRCSPTFDSCSSSTPYGDFTERIDGPNGDWAQTFDASGFFNGAGAASVTGTFNTFDTTSSDSPLSLIVRYFSLKDLNARSEIWLWKDRTTSGAARSVNAAVYDEAENVHSVTFSLPDEVNFKPTSDIITPGVNGGWFRITFPCGQFGSCTYNYLTPSAAVQPPIQAVAYSLQFADSAGASAPSSSTLRWDAIFPAHRQYTSYRGVSE